MRRDPAPNGSNIVPDPADERDKDGVPPKFQPVEASNVHVIEDAKQNRMDSLTFGVGKPR